MLCLRGRQHSFKIVSRFPGRSLQRWANCLCLQTVSIGTITLKQQSHIHMVELVVVRSELSDHATLCLRMVELVAGSVCARQSSGCPRT